MPPTKASTAHSVELDKSYTGHTCLMTSPKSFAVANSVACTLRLSVRNRCVSPLTAVPPCHSGQPVPTYFLVKGGNTWFTSTVTGWPCIAKIGRTASSADVIRVYRGWFADIGVPSILTTDGGPQFSSRRFAEFCTRWQVQHSTSSPQHPQSNGYAEAAVKAMK